MCIFILYDWFLTLIPTILDKRLWKNSKNKVKQVFLWNVLQLIFCEFLPKISKFGFCAASWVLAIRSKHFRDFLEISYFLKIVWHLVRQLMHSLFGDNNMLSFYLWWRQISLKREKIYKLFVQHCLKTSLLIFTSFYKNALKL